MMFAKLFPTGLCEVLREVQRRFCSFLQRRVHRSERTLRLCSEQCEWHHWSQSVRYLGLQWRAWGSDKRMSSTLDSKQNGNNYHSSLKQEEMTEVATPSIQLFSHCFISCDFTRKTYWISTMLSFLLTNKHKHSNFLLLLKFEKKQNNSSSIFIFSKPNNFFKLLWSKKIPPENQMTFIHTYQSD